MGRKWEEFEDFDNVNDILPRTGDGDDMAQQASTCVCKLVYRWFNDGDVYDNRYGMGGWLNDISWAANWLYSNVPETKKILRGIENVYRPDDYTDLLYDLTKTVDGLIPSMMGRPKAGSVYDAEGPFEFVDPEDDEEEDR